MSFWMMAVLSLLLAGCGKYEKREREVGFKGEAKLNHLLAAERLATELGLNASSYAGAPSLPPAAGSTLVLPAETLQSVGQLSEIGDWISEGGNLVAYLTLQDEERSAFEEEEEPFQAFLEYFSLEAVPVKKAGKGKQDLQIRSLGFQDDKKYEADFRTPYLLLDYDSPNRAPRVLQSYNYGDGTLTVLATAELFTNESIGKEEHATLLYDLLSEGQEEQVWIIYSTRLSFFKLLWQQAPYAVVTLLMTILLLVWWASRGFGPKFVRGANPLARLDEHLEASGSFFVKHGADALVISELQGRLFRDLARALNQPLHAPRADLLSLADKQGFLDATERGALTSQPTGKTLLTTLQTLKNLDKKL